MLRIVLSVVMFRFRIQTQPLRPDVLIVLMLRIVLVVVVLRFRTPTQQVLMVTN